MATDKAAPDTFLSEVDEALRKRVAFAWQCVGVTIVAALMASMSVYLIQSSGEADGWRSWISDLVPGWADWAHGWASTTEVNVTVAGMSTATLTLYVATALQPISPDVTASGAASRILLDGITLVACVISASAAWVLAAAAGWHQESALGWAPAVAAGLLLSVLAASTEARQLTRRHSQWALLRAQENLEHALGDAPARSWVHAFPWRRCAGSALVASLPAAAGLVLAHPHDPGTLAGVAILTAMVATVWFLLIGALWSSVAKIRALRTRHGRWYASDLLASYFGDAGLVGLVGFLAWVTSDTWGIASFALAVLLGVTSRRVPGSERLHHRQLHRQLADVGEELAWLTPLITDPPQAPPPAAGSSTGHLTPSDTDWVLRVGSIQVLRFSRPAVSRTPPPR